jgi:Ricin-type beta-trefoil lectin domain
VGTRWRSGAAVAAFVLVTGLFNAAQASATGLPGDGVSPTAQPTATGRPTPATQSSAAAQPSATARPTATSQSGAKRDVATSAKSMRLCPPASKRGEMSCMSELHLPTSGSGIQPYVWNGMFEPQDLRNAYGLPSVSAGTRQTVAVVDAYDDPKAESDLAVYRSHYKIPPCTTANGCFRKVNQRGTTSYPRADAGWAGEISLDLDMVSAVCPNCRILLVEADSSSMDDLGTAVNKAVSLGAKYVSNSYGGAEDPTETTADVTYFNHPGVAITASTGDSGYGVSYPAASQYVTAVGGTTLATSTGVRGWTETAWSGAGSGCSAYEPKPSWQHDTVCSGRSVADVSAIADPGVVVYDSVPYDGYSGWLGFGGTSVSSPIIAATYALAGTPASSSNPASYPYSHSGALNDVTSGTNGGTGGCDPTALCTAGSGWDGPTGLGTPVGTTSLSATGALTGPVTSGVFGKCLDDHGNGSADSNPIDIWSCNGSAGQRWTTASDGTVRINGKCMGLNGGGTANGTKVVLLTCDGTGSQEWRPKSGGQLVNPQSGRCLDDPGSSTTNGNQLDIYTCVGSANEQWTPPYAVPTYAGPITSRVKSTLCIRTSGTANGSAIQIYTCNGNTGQKVTVAADGTLRLQSKCIDVPGSKTANGTKLDLWTCVGQGNQQWRVLGNGALVNPESGRCIDDPGSSTTPGTRLDIYSCVYSKNELWRLP